MLTYLMICSSKHLWNQNNLTEYIKAHKFLIVNIQVQLCSLAPIYNKYFKMYKKLILARKTKFCYYMVQNLLKVQGPLKSGQEFKLVNILCTSSKQPNWNWRETVIPTFKDGIFIIYFRSRPLSILTNAQTHLLKI